jgi:hypothetical protein
VSFRKNEDDPTLNESVESDEPIATNILYAGRAVLVVLFSTDEFGNPEWVLAHQHIF